MGSIVGHSGALLLWSIVVEHLGEPGLWSLEDCGALWSEVEHWGAFWSIVGVVVSIVVVVVEHYGALWIIVEHWYQRRADPGRACPSCGPSKIQRPYKNGRSSSACRASGQQPKRVSTGSMLQRRETGGNTAQWQRVSLQNVRHALSSGGDASGIPCSDSLILMHM